VNAKARVFLGFMLATLGVLVLAAPGAAGSRGSGLFRERTQPAAEEARAAWALGSESSLLAQRVIEETEKEKKAPERQPRGLKSPPKAFLMSAAVPGAGELYGGKKRGFVFLGVEVMAWSAYYFYHSSGRDKEDEYISFADGHYSTDRLASTECGRPLEAAMLDSLKQANPQHFYEDISKYEWALCGWKDLEILPDSSFYSADREKYREMRSKSNELLRKARYFTMFALLNHVLSSIDAVRVVRDYNEKLTKKTGLSLKYRFAGNGVYGGVAYRFD